MSSTPRLGMPMLSPGQAQKELYHNEALQTLDVAVSAAVEGEPINVPPPAPALGACYIVGDAPTDAWAGKARSIAGYTSGGWRFVGPVEGLTVFLKSAAVSAVYKDGMWEIGKVTGDSLVIGGQQVVGARSSAIGSPSGGAVVDAEARSAINQILQAMRQHGLIAV